MLLIISRDGMQRAREAGGKGDPDDQDSDKDDS